MASSQQPQQSGSSDKTPLLLEDKTDDNAIKLDMSSGSASVELGPVVVNEDGEPDGRLDLSGQLWRLTRGSSC